MHAGAVAIRRSLPALMVLASSLCLSGCGTLLALGMNHNPDASQIYGGTRVDVVVPLVALRIIPTEEKLPSWTAAWSLLLLDLPFSFVADTVLLPITVYHHFAVRGRNGDAETPSAVSDSTDPSTSSDQP